MSSYDLEVDVPELTNDETGVDGTFPVTIQEPGFFDKLRLSGALPEHMAEIESEADAMEMDTMDTREVEETITFMETMLSIVTDIPDDVIEVLSEDAMSTVIDACSAVINGDDPYSVDGVDGKPNDAPEFETTQSDILKN